MPGGNTINTFIERHADKISGTLSCFDRAVITGTIPGICYSDGMTGYLNHLGIRIFDYTKWADPLRERIRHNAECMAREAGLKIHYIQKRGIRKEEVIARIIEKRGEYPGLAAIISTMEACPSFQPWHDKGTHKTFLRYKEGKCLHYYFYFIDENLGLCYLRVPTWAPFRVQFYFNGHNWLASRLRAEGVGFNALDNAFVFLDDFKKAQELSDGLKAEVFHPLLDRFARRYCPVIEDFPCRFHWSPMQVEYATDIIFKRQSDLAPIYEECVRTATHSVKPENIATYLGRKLNGNYRDEMGNNFNTRIEGTCINHHMGKVAIKMYDTFHLVLRIETTTNDVSFFTHWREVNRRDGTSEMKFAVMNKHPYSLDPLREAMQASNRRYLDALAAIDDLTANHKDLDKISRPVWDAGRRWAGFNFFHDDDAQLFRTLLRGEFCIGGFRNADLRAFLPGKTQGQISRLLKRLRKHGLIKKAGRCYKYYLTTLGQRVAMIALKHKEMCIIPLLRGLTQNV